MKKSSNSTTTRQPSEKQSLLNDIQKSIKQIDEQRLAVGLSDEEREILDLSAVALRDAERLAILRLQKEAVKDMEKATERLNAFAREIREKVKQMNKVPKALDITEKIIKQAVRVLVSVGKWK